MPRMSKDGAAFYDVDDSDESLSAAKAKGYKEYLPMTKNGKDVFDVEASEDSYKAATAKGYQDVDAYNFTKDVGKPGKAESTFRGQISGLAQGYGDELGGKMEEMGAKVGLRGIGSPDLTDIRLETDAEDKQAPEDIYRGMRDRRRDLNKAAETAHPGYYLAGDVTGSVASGMLVPGSSTIKGGAALGAVQGLGRSQADLTKPTAENLQQAAIDTVGGGLMGGGGVIAGKAIGAGANAVAKAPETAKAGWEFIKQIGRGASRGAKEAGEDVPGLLFVKPSAEVMGGIKGALDELRGIRSTADEIKGIAAEARDFLSKQSAQATTPTGVRQIRSIQAFGNGKAIGEFSDDEAIMAAMFSEGPNPVKKLMTEKAGMMTGQIDGGDYEKVLNLGSEARTAAREFDPRESAKALKPVVEEVQNLFKSARNERFNELQTAAKGTFDNEGASSVLSSLDESIVDANSLNSVPGSVRGLLDDVHGMLNSGKGTKQQGLTAGAWEEVDPAEKFHRLQKSRELLDGQIKWAGREGHSQAEGILKGLRDDINAALKTSPEKVEGDALYKASKELEAKFFGATEFKNAAGGIDIDEAKIARLLGKTDPAIRFQGAMGELREFAKRKDLAPEFRAKAEDLIAKFDEHIGTADTKRAISELRYKNGPSSPAIERMSSATRGNSILRDAVEAPAAFANNVDQFSKMLKSRIGKGFDALDPQEKIAAVRFRTWMSKNPDADLATVDREFAKYFGGKP